jgi:hypothetical protein
MRSTKRRKSSISREAKCILSKACFKVAIQWEVKAKQRKSRRKIPVKRKKRRESKQANAFGRKPALKPLYYTFGGDG